MRNISKAMLEHLKATYTLGTRVRLVRMEDPYTKLKPGSTGTVACVDDIGTIHVAWDCGSSLGVCYGEDSCEVIKEEQK